MLLRLSFVTLVLATPVLAAESVRDLYVRGDYAAAIRAGEAENTAVALAEAARAAIADAQMQDRPCLACLARAEDLSRRAVTMDAGNIEGQVLFAVAVGLEARIVKTLRAKVNRYPEQAKEALDKAVALAPNHGAALAAMGAWHIEVMRNGGMLGTIMYGADVETGRNFYHRGIAADPGNLVLPYQFALSLAGIDFDKYRVEVGVLLDTASKGTPRTSYEAALRTRVVELAALLKGGRTRELAGLVRKYQGYP